MIGRNAELIIAPVLLLAGLFVLTMTGLSHAREAALRDRGVETLAEVVAFEHRSSDSDSGVQVRYRFQVDGRAYEHVGLFGTPVSPDVSPEVEQEGRETGHIAVRYVPDNPSVNAPLKRARPPGQKAMIGFAIGAVLLAIGALRLIVALRARRVPVSPSAG